MKEIIKFSLRNLSQQKMRTGLTLLGIVIGIAAVVSLMSLGAGLTNAIEENLEQLGPNNIIVSPKFSGGFGPSITTQQLSEKDLKIIKKIKNVDIAVPVVLKNMPVEYSGAERYLTIIGIPPEDSKRFFEDLQSFELLQGRFIKEGEHNTIVVGYNIYKNIFDKEVRLRNKIIIGDEKFRVIGILDEIGNAQNDNAIMMFIDDLRSLTGDDDEISYIFAKVFEDPRGTAEKIEQALEDYHNKKLFVATTTEQLIERISSIFGILSLVLGGIAAISLLVAGIGIMNIMLMVITERTKEIGVMKAIGATNRRILVIFLFESAIIGFIGGIIGIILGYIFSFGLSGIASGFIGLKLLIKIDYLLIVGSLIFSIIVGTISGLYPAYRAARLQPVEALRYE